MAPKQKTEAEQPRLGEDKWLELKPKVHQAGVLAAQSLQLWGEVCADAVYDRPHADWRWILADLREYCFKEGEECPYQVAYMVQLAETHLAIKGNWDRGVQPSVLIEGRKLPDLIDIVEHQEPGCSVSRMKARVFKASHPTTEKSLDEIEETQSIKRRDQRKRSRHAEHIQRIMNWSADEAELLLPNLKQEAVAYEETIRRLAAEEGVTFDSEDVDRTLRTVKDLNRVLKNVVHTTNV